MYEDGVWDEAEGVALRLGAVMSIPVFSPKGNKLVMSNEACFSLY
jgi:hypothetical protein